MFYMPPNTKNLGQIDHALIWSALLLVCVSLVMVYSASVAIAEASKAMRYSGTYFVTRHAIAIAWRVTK
jgi:cell division protein FtsW